MLIFSVNRWFETSLARNMQGLDSRCGAATARTRPWFLIYSETMLYEILASLQGWILDELLT
jgi:hypothetical protein